MSRSTRRGFMALSATGLAAAAAVPSAFASGREDTAAADGSVSGPLVAYVHDAATGEVAVLRGEHEVVVHDPQLVRLLTKHLPSREV